MSSDQIVLERIVLFSGAAAGVALGLIDSRPSFDDTGVMAAAILVVAFLLGALSPRRPWAIALAVGTWIPLFGILGTRNYGSVLALAFAFAGAYGGSLLRRVILPV